MTTSLPHRKHAALARPSVGRFGRNEFAFLGTDCATIKNVCGQLIAALSPRWRVGYADAAHPKNDQPERQPERLPGRLADGAAVEFSDNIGHRQVFLQNAESEFQDRPFFNETNLVFINGNHFEGQKQVVFIDPKKEASLRKRLGQLTDVAAIILADRQNEPFDWLKTALPDWADVPVFHQKDAAGLASFFEKTAQSTVAPLLGLVLAGGHSQRMGRDKGLIEWHGRPQREHLADLLREAVGGSGSDDQPAAERVFLSVRPGQLAEAPPFAVVEDSFLGLGPFGAILSAFRARPDAAWLVAACDLPLLDAATLDFLVKNRRPDRLATAFRNPTDGLPEPLVAIWEPMAYAAMLSFLAQGRSCPRKVLMNTGCHLLDAPSPAALTNVNTPEEAAAVRQLLGG